MFRKALHRVGCRRKPATDATRNVHRAPSDILDLTTQIDFANRLFKEGRYREAQEQYDSALCGYRQIKADDDPGVLVLEYTQAQNYLRSGNLAAAQKLLRHLSKLSQESLGPAHPRTLLYLDTLASAYIRSGDLASADPVLKNLLKARTETGCIEDAHTTLANASVVVTSYLNRDRWADALPLQALVVGFLRRHRSPFDTEMLLSCSLLAVTLVELGKFAEARRLLQTVSSSFVQTLGREHKETLRVFFLLALVMEKEDDLVSAQAILERSYALALSHLGEGDELTLRMGTKLGCFFLNAHRYADGQNLLLSLVPIAQRVTGADSGTTLTNMNNLAVALWEQGKLTLARGIAAEVLTRKEAKLGGTHPETRQALEQLSDMDCKLARCATEGRVTEESAADQDDCIRIDGSGELCEIPYTLRLRGFPIPKWKQ